MYILVGLGLLFLDLCGLYVLTYFRGKYGWSKEEYEKTCLVFSRRCVFPWYFGDCTVK